MYWPIRDILDFLDENAITLIIRSDGTTSIRTDPADRSLETRVAISKVMPHLKGRREEIVALFHEHRKEAFSDPRNRNCDRRKEVIAFARVIAAAAKKPVWLLCADGVPRTYHEITARDARGATHICVEGEVYWVKLPK
jgi:hypothetical protein